MADENEKEPIETDEEENLEETGAEGTEDGEEGEHEDVDDSDESDEDEEEFEDDDSDEDESSALNKKAAAAAAAAAAVAKRKKTGRKKTGRKKKPANETSGQRLARAKKAKAERKAAERDKEREVEDELEGAAIEQAEVAASFLEKNQKPIIIGMIGIAVAAAIFFGYQKFAEGAKAESSAALWSAVGTANAEVVAEEDAAADSDRPERETYETIQARAEAALEKFRAVQSDFPGSDAAAYAALGEANSLYGTGEFTEAREVYERVLDDAGDDTNLSVRAIEGIAFTFEAGDNWDSAKERYEELKDVDHPQAEPLARLHLARVALHNNDEETAKAELRTLLESLREEGAPQLPYVRDQAELRLMALDSSLVQRAPDFSAGGLQGAPEDLQRQIEELMRQQQQQKQGQ